VAARSFGLFSDEVFTSTDLNRRSAEVLNRASRSPVTIARNNERFALLRREQAASLVQGVAQLVEVVEVAQAALAMRKGLPVAPALAWIQSLDDDDRMSMLTEILAACVQASAEDRWGAVGDLLHEWQESASVAESGVLREAMESQADPQPLPEPSSVVGETGR